MGQTDSKEHANDSKRYKTTVIVGVLLLLFLGGYIRIHEGLSANDDTRATTARTVTPTLPPSVPQTSLTLNPNPAARESDGNIPVYVSMNTQNNQVTSLQFTITFDPQSLKADEVEPDDAFYGAEVVSKNVDNVNGKIELTLKLNPQQMKTPVRGGDHVAEISFKAKKNSGITAVNLAEASVTSPDTQKSVLTKTTGTTVNLQAL